MNKEELVIALSAKTGLTHKAAEEALEAVIETVMDIVRDGDRVAITGFGAFELIERAGRKGRNPKTGEVIEIPAKKVPRFTPGKRFLEAAQ
jgi:DNA-binding protein HU-beta